MEKKFTFRVSDEDKKALQVIADRQGISLSKLVRRQALKLLQTT